MRKAAISVITLVERRLLPLHGVLDHRGVEHLVVLPTQRIARLDEQAEDLADHRLDREQEHRGEEGCQGEEEHDRRLHKMRISDSKFKIPDPRETLRGLTNETNSSRPFPHGKPSR